MTTAGATTGRGGRTRGSRVAERRSIRRSTAVRPGLFGGSYQPLSAADVQRIADTALDVLANIGFSAVTDEIRDYALAKGAHFNANGRLCFPRSLVEDLIANAAREIVYHGRDDDRTVRSGGNRVYFATSGEAVRFVDPDTGAYRPSTLLDLYDFFRMGDFLEHIDFCGQQVVATDICEDPRLHALNIAYAGAAATTKPFSISLAEASTVGEVESLWDSILGAPGSFRERPFAAIGVCPVVSPLRFGPDTSAVLCEAARRRLERQDGLALEQEDVELGREQRSERLLDRGVFDRGHWGFGERLHRRSSSGRFSLRKWQAASAFARVWPRDRTQPRKSRMWKVAG